jgi:hypothetical protein
MSEEHTEVERLVGFSADKLIGGYKAVEEARDKLAAEHKVQIKPLEDRMQEIIGALTIKADKEGVKNFSSAYGTFCFTTGRKVKVADVVDWFDWVIESKAWECLTKHVSKDEVLKYADEVGGQLPGLEIEGFRTGHVRKPS